MTAPSAFPRAFPAVFPRALRTAPREVVSADAPARVPARTLPSALLRAVARLGPSGILALHRQRRTLGALDARLLHDIGVSPDAAGREAARPLWDVPSTWLR